MIYLYIIFTLLAVHYFLFLLKIYNGLGKISSPSFNGTGEYFISIIVPFRNEAQNISKSISSIEQLDFPTDKFEVIYVDDNSDDNSFQLAESVKKASNIRVLKLPGDGSGNGNKKKALRYGIENSKGDIIVTTDADCIHHKNWLQHIINCFDKETAFVSGPVEFNEAPGMFSRIQSTEFGGLILAGAGLIGAGSPLICNGANIAYRKKVFDELGGFNDNLHLASGDDEFLMQKIARKTNYKIRFCPEREAVVLTDPSHSISSFLNQRKRWASKSLFYNDIRLTARLVLIFLFYAGLIIQTVLVLTGSPYFAITLAVSLLVKVLMELMIIRRGMNLFLSKKKISVFLMTELFQVPYIIVSAIGGLAGGFAWKGRNLRR